MQKVIVHYSEIGLKGKNKPFFENKLIENIKKSSIFNKTNLQDIKKEGARIICEFDDEKEKIDETLKNVFGIKYFSYVENIRKNTEEILNKAKKHLQTLKKKGYERVALKTKRSDKSFPLTSVELNTKIGEIATSTNLKIDFRTPQITIYILITLKNAYIYDEVINGFGGLPVGTSGKTLTLLSGGIDSPVAAWNMMRRGCTCDFIHFHTYKENNEILNTKIKTMVEILNKYQFKSKLYLVPYSIYEFMTLGKIYPRYELVFFKHYILKVAEKIAKENGYDAIVNGDNLAQVASQTIENLNAASTDITMQIFRPLLTYEKEEIITMAKNIQTYDLSIMEYKDCCSVFAKNPATKTKPEKFLKIQQKFDINPLVKKSIDEMEIFEID